jgi:hypothetical protein
VTDHTPHPECERDGPATPGRSGCPGGRNAVWIVAGVPSCSACLPAVVALAIHRLKDWKVNVWTVDGWKKHWGPA